MAMYEIEGNKLKRELQLRNLTMSEAAKIIDLSPSTIGEAVNTGKLSKKTLKLLKEKFSIELDDLLPETKKEPEYNQLSLEDYTGGSSSELIPIIKEILAELKELRKEIQEAKQ